MSDNWITLAGLWLFSVLATLAVVVGKIGHKLFGIATDPPEDPTAFRHWRRRRMWLIYSEILAVPAFASISVAATVHLGLSTAACVGLSMLLGAVGFGALLDAAGYIFRKRLGVPGNDAA